MVGSRSRVQGGPGFGGCTFSNELRGTRDHHSVAQHPLPGLVVNIPVDSEDLHRNSVAAIYMRETTLITETGFLFRGQRPNGVEFVAWDF
ncbi:hypothetical protein VTH82DRAFT_4228 [Thermothelomyces myriococcoides]